MVIKKTITAILTVYVLLSALFAVHKETLRAQQVADHARANAQGSALTTVSGDLAPDLTSGLTGGFEPAANLQPDRVIMYYFHRNLRCVSCIEVEDKMHEVIDEYFREAVDAGILEVKTVNIDLPENAHFIEDYALYYSSLVFVEIRAGVEMGWDDFAEVWTAYGNDERLIESLRTEIGKWVAMVEPS